MLLKSCLHEEQDIEDVGVVRSVDDEQSITGALMS